MSDISNRIRAKLAKTPEGRVELEELLGRGLADKVEQAPLSDTVSEEIRDSIEFVHDKTGEIEEAPGNMTNAELIGVAGKIPRLVSLKVEDWGLMAVQGEVVHQGSAFAASFDRLSPLGKVFANAAGELTLEQMEDLVAADQKDEEERKEYEAEQERLAEESKGKKWFIETPDGKRVPYSLDNLIRATKD